MLSNPVRNTAVTRTHLPDTSYENHRVQNIQSGTTLVYILYAADTNGMTNSQHRAVFNMLDECMPSDSTICVDTDQGKVNSDGYSCSYINFLHDNEKIEYDCDTQADTSSLTRQVCAVVVAEVRAGFEER